MDRHRKGRENDFTIGKAVLIFQTKMGQMPGKLRFRWIVPYWIVGVENDMFQLGTLAGDVLRPKVNGFRLKPYLGPMPPNPFHAVVNTAEDSTYQIQRPTYSIM